jgi:hypothetical protein
MYWARFGDGDRSARFPSLRSKLVWLWTIGGASDVLTDLVQVEVTAVQCWDQYNRSFDEPLSKSVPAEGCYNPLPSLHNV